MKSKDEINDYYNLLRKERLIILPFMIFFIPVTLGVSLLLYAFIMIADTVETSLYKEKIRHIAIKYGFNKKDLLDYGLEKYIAEILNSKENEKKKVEKVVFLLEELIKYIGPIHFAIKSKTAILQIKNFIDKLSKKNGKDWNSFNIEKI